MSPRETRLAPPALEEFRKRVIPIATESTLASTPWYRLSTKAHATQFYPSPNSRLTPRSLSIPCCYLAPSKETTVAEIWGDTIDAERRAAAKDPTPSNVFTLSKAIAGGQAYLQLRTPLPTLALCDLTDVETLGKTGFEKGALYSPDLKIPQQWAELIALHDLRFDGIIYRSRHTDEKCLVLFSRPVGRDLKSKLVFDPAGEFRHSLAAQRLAARIGMRISFLDI